MYEDENAFIDSLFASIINLKDEIESLKNSKRTSKAKNKKLKAKIESLEKENAELKARLEKAVELPCKVGDVVYESNIDRNIVNTYTIKEISIFPYGTRYDWELIDGIYSNVPGFFDMALGKTIFLSKDQAEAKLKEIKEKEE